MRLAQPQARGDLGPLECPKCKGSTRVIALIEDFLVVRAILVHLGRWQPKDHPLPGIA